MLLFLIGFVMGFISILVVKSARRRLAEYHDKKQYEFEMAVREEVIRRMLREDHRSCRPLDNCGKHPQWDAVIQRVPGLADVDPFADV